MYLWLPYSGQERSLQGLPQKKSLKSGLLAFCEGTHSWLGVEVLIQRQATVVYITRLE